MDDDENKDEKLSLSDISVKYIKMALAVARGGW